MKLISTKINESQKNNKFRVLHYQVYNMDFYFLCWVTSYLLTFYMFILQYSADTHTFYCFIIRINSMSFLKCGYFTLGLPRRDASLARLAKRACLAAKRANGTNPSKQVFAADWKLFVIPHDLKNRPADCGMLCPIGMAMPRGAP